MQIDWSDVELSTISFLVFFGMLLAGTAVQAQPTPPSNDAPPPGPGGIGGTDGTTSLELWLDAGTLSLSDGESVDAWSDLSGNEKDVSQGTSSKQPTYRASTLNGEPVLEFDGSDDVLSSSGSLGLTAGYTIFVVAKNDNRKYYNGLFRIAPNVSDETSRLELYWSDGTGGSGDLVTAGNRGGSFRADSTENAGPSTGTFYLATAHIGSGGTDAIRYIDGGSLSSDATDGSGTQVPGQADPFYVGIGRGDNSDGTLDGNVAEVIAYSKELNEARRTIVNTYLANKYGLGTGNAEVESYAHTSNHFNDFAGLGQAGGTQETEARSGALQLKNPGSLGNGDFLFVGHDGADASSWSTTNVPSTVSERLDREWRIDENGTVGNLTVEIDAGDLPSVSSESNYYVLVSDDNDFTTTSNQTRTKLTLDTDSTYNASGVSLDVGSDDDDDYVTLAHGAAAATPQNLTAESDLNQSVALDWDAVTTDAAGNPTTLTGDKYRVYQNTSDNFSGASQVTTSSTASTTVTGLNNGTTYYFWVTAVNDIGESDEQDPVNRPTATPALKVEFVTSSSSVSEDGTPSIDVTLSDSHDQDVTADLSTSGNLRSATGINSASGGSNYTAGDILVDNDPSDGDGGSGLRIEVTSVSSGSVTGAQVNVGGSGYNADPVTVQTLDCGDCSDASASGASIDVNTQPSADDYTLSTTTVTIPSSDSDQTITLDGNDLSINDDSYSESTENLPLDLSNASTSGASASIGSPNSHSLSITDNDVNRDVYLVDNVDTNDDGTSSKSENVTVTYTVETDNDDSVSDIDVGWEVDTSAAASGATAADFDSLSGTATISSGATDTTFDLPIKDDGIYEQNEDIKVRLTSATNAALKDAQGCSENTNGCYKNMTHTIEDDENAPTVRFRSNTSEADESGGPNIQVSLENCEGNDNKCSSYEDIDVDLQDTGGTADGGGTDYTLNTTTLTIPSGQTDVKIDETDLSINDDPVNESDETVELTLQSISSGDASIDGTKDTHTFTIIDNDSVVPLTITGSAGNEGSWKGELGGDAGWRMVGPPVTGQTVGDITSNARDTLVILDLASGHMLYEWDDTAGSGPGDWAPLTSYDDNFDNGRGHLLFLWDNPLAPIDQDLTIDLKGGTEPSGDQTVSGLNTEATYHILANPFNSPFDLSSLEDANNNSLGSGSTDFSTTVQIWDGGDSSGEDKATAGSYLDVSVNTSDNSGTSSMADSGDVVSAWQGFVVERSSPGSSGQTELTFQSEGTTSGARSIVGSKVQTAEPTHAKIGLKMVVESERGGQAARDEAASLYFHDNARMGWDDFDASKLAPLSDPYAVIGPVGPVRGDSTAIKAVEGRPMPSRGATIEVPVQLRTVGDVSGTARVSTDAWTGVPDNWSVALIDTKGTSEEADDDTTRFSPSDAYTFELTSGSSKAAEGNERAAKTQRAVPPTSGRPPAVRSLTAREAVADPSSGTATGQSAGTKVGSSVADSPARFHVQIEVGNNTSPVELDQMEARTDDGQVALEWTTASETNNAGFHVEHQHLPAGDTTAAPAPGEWERLTFVEGAGTTTNTQTYRHTTGELRYGRHVFRLCQVNTDGSTTLTDPVEATVRLQTAYSVDAPYPNPARERTTLPVTVRKHQEVTVEVYDVLGRRIRTAYDEDIPAQTTTHVPISVRRLGGGAYFLRVRGDTFSTTRRITVVK